MTSEEMNEAIKENEKLVYFIVRHHYPTFRFNDDVIQCGRIGLWKALNNYDETKGAFGTFASRIIKNEIAMYFRQLKKSSKDISIETKTYTDDEDGTTIGDSLIGSEDIEYEHSNEDLIWDWIATLKDKDRIICDMRIMGSSVSEIGKAVGIKEPAVWMRLNHLKKKYKHTIEKFLE